MKGAFASTDKLQRPHRAPGAELKSQLKRRNPIKKLHKTHRNILNEHVLPFNIPLSKHGVAEMYLYTKSSDATQNVLHGGGFFRKRRK